MARFPSGLAIPSHHVSRGCIWRQSTECMAPNHFRCWGRILPLDILALGQACGEPQVQRAPRYRVRTARALPHLAHMRGRSNGNVEHLCVPYPIACLLTTRRTRTRVKHRASSTVIGRAPVATNVRLQ